MHELRRAGDLVWVPGKNARLLLARAYQLQNKKNLFLLGTLLAGYAKICKRVNRVGGPA